MADVRLLLKKTTAARNQQAENTAAGKKRKAASAALSAPAREEKKSKSVAFASPQATAGHDEPLDQHSTAPASNQADEPDNREKDDGQAHAAELAALDRELAMMAAEHAAQSSSTISAPPVSAVEIAAEARIEQSAQRSSRDAEMDAERQDAERALIDEFDVLEGLEERVQRLRSRREALRSSTNPTVARSPQHVDAERSSSVEARTDSVEDQGADEDNDDDDDEDDDDGDDLAGWHFGSRSR
ncbi:hypothetical protein Slin15195_G015170 [Septoria linicola]|uniref:Uncharacterized protein n=1 Tax=Septoria linicola TaxID=215465 RepID=A0A9Q9EGF1_9PEZI|nr:hypothetical protein Slin15195_G015170 [Septoria linicola]